MEDTTALISIARKLKADNEKILRENQEIITGTKKLEGDIQIMEGSNEELKLRKRLLEEEGQGDTERYELTINYLSTVISGLEKELSDLKLLSNPENTANEMFEDAENN